MKNKPLAALFLTILIDLLGFGIIIPILPIFAEELGAPGYIIGIIAGSYSFMQFLFAPFWGSLSDRFGRRPIIIGSVAITFFAYIVFAYTNNLWLLAISRILSGIGAANISAAQAYISDLTPPENRAKSFGIIGAAFGLGFIFGPPVGGFLKSSYGIQAVGFFTAALCLINIIVAFRLLPESISIKNKSIKVQFNPFADIKEVFQLSGLKMLISTTFIFISAFSMMQITAALLWQQKYGLNEAQIGYVFTYIGLITAIIQGTLIGKFNQWFGEMQLLIYGCLLMIIGLTALPYIPFDYFIPLELVALACIGLGNAFLMPTITSLISKLAPEGEQGKILGINQSIGSLGRVFGPLAGGALYTLDLHLPYLGGAVLMLLCLLIALSRIKKIIHP
jgi:multidrug resistance protein